MVKGKSKDKIMIAAALGIAAYFYFNREQAPPPPVDFNTNATPEQKKVDWAEFFKNFWPAAKKLGQTIYEAWTNYKKTHGTTTYDVTGKGGDYGSFAGIGAVEPYVKLTFSNNEEVAKYFSKLPQFPATLTRRQRPGLNGFFLGAATGMTREQARQRNLAIIEYRNSYNGGYYVTSNIDFKGQGIRKAGDGSDHKRGLMTYHFTENALNKLKQQYGSFNVKFFPEW